MNIAIRGLTTAECKAICQAPRSLPNDATSFQIWKARRDELLIGCSTRPGPEWASC